ncbi:putative tripeptidyl-peptidase II [Rosa chinensis]|uniref:Putative tripeptidyl-peptidase II n=1 Tax=Rosa chinensis TaxID=74649 RepID=A0A2P6RT11_ROSCH|nr:subtilisin-like protease SBT1.5 [Rosa chinensis]PRQ49569.1 putative tripeptidyl-peptidase II [Rosa chinensis]
MSLYPFLIYALFFSYWATVSRSEVFIVRVQNDLKPPQHSINHEWYASTLNTLSATNDSLHYVYNTVFHGFSADLTTQQANQLRQHPEIVSVFRDRLLKHHTTRSPAFLGLNTNETNDQGILKLSDSGANVIIGVIDSGIWPEHRSFHDHGLGPIPSHWKGRCLPGDYENAATFCNRKIIGARYFTRGINNKTEVSSARDDVGHGTHTASTMAGRHVGSASFLGFAKGVASGMAPKARLAVYRVCGKIGCAQSDVLAGIEQAVQDGVDVISMSLGGDSSLPYDKDPIAIATFAATEKGIVCSASGGNAGPDHGTVTNVAPWITTIGASTIDRDFRADLVLGNGRVITGCSLYHGTWPEKASAPLVYTGGMCMELTNKKRIPDLVRGNIVVCNYISTVFPEDFDRIRNAGAVGMVGIEQNDLLATPYSLPALAIRRSARDELLRYMNVTKNARAAMRFRGTVTGVKPAPVVADFSSRGPNLLSPFVVKPDVIAPGVNILAAWPQFDDLSDFSIMSGTSMSCPHVSGIAALLRGARSSWSPAMIKSAMMTTAYTKYRDGGPLLDELHRHQVVWGIGAGHVDPQKALDPGLVYDLKVDDYINFLCASNYSDEQVRAITQKTTACKGRKGFTQPWDFNYPAISPVFDVTRWPKSKDVIVRKSVTNVGEGSSTYIVRSVINPFGVKVRVIPPILKFSKKGEIQSYVVKFTADKNVGVPRHGNVAFGQLIWTDGKHNVSSPITVTYMG